jgi:sensor histidine kinase YesM
VASIARSPNPEDGPLNPDIQAPSFSGEAARQLHDAAIRIVMIPLFGVVVPHITGYFGPIEPADARYWFGLLWGCLISFLIWHGNRYFLIKQRQHYDWFQHPVRKLTVLIFASIFYTASCTVLLMLAWFRFASLETDWVVIRSVTFASVVCVLFITHVYETVFLIQQRESDLIAVERLERARTEAELQALKVQVAPHFLFNSLNTLAWLIENSREKALEFNQNLADVYRYILLARRRELVPIDDELFFVRQYFSLLAIGSRTA